MCFGERQEVVAVVLESLQGEKPAQVEVEECGHRNSDCEDHCNFPGTQPALCFRSRHVTHHDALLAYHGDYFSGCQCRRPLLSRPKSPGLMYLMPCRTQSRVCYRSMP